MLQIFLQSLLIGYSGAMMPGSLLTYTIEKSIKSGVRAGVLVSAGHAVLEFFLVILLFLGVGRYLQTQPAQLIIGFAGGLVLIFFGTGMLRDVIRGRLKVDTSGGHEDRNGGIILSGAVISASNPYFAIWWAAAGLGLMMKAYNAFGPAGVASFYIGHISADFSWYVLISFLIGRTRRFINIKVYRIIIAVLGAALIGFGIYFMAGSVNILL